VGVEASATQEEQGQHAPCLTERAEAVAKQLDDLGI
jgi:hypothetical protein